MVLMDRILSTGLKNRMTQLLVSVSIFSLVFSWSSPLMYYEKLYCFSWNTLQLLSIAMNKNCIFLICNGILVFLAKTSPFVPSFSPSDLNDLLQKRVCDGPQIQIELEPEPEPETEPVFEKHIMLDESGNVSIEEGEDEEEGEIFECSNGRVEEVSISIRDQSDGDVENEKSGPRNCFHFYDENDNDDNDNDEQIYAEKEEELEKLSREELNQKCEDFIRRMKEEFRVNEARQQLVVVN